MTWQVTFVGVGFARTVEYDSSTHVYRHHGRPGSLLDIALANDVPLEHVCGGNCACTTCHVHVLDGMDRLSPLDEAEADRLDSAWDLRPDSRLACQAVVRGEVVCEIPRHTRNETVS
jgi:2Fe-2S ferredoxin